MALSPRDVQKRRSRIDKDFVAAAEKEIDQALLAMDVDPSSGEQIRIEFRCGRIESSPVLKATMAALAKAYREVGWHVHGVSPGHIILEHGSDEKGGR